MKRYVQVTKDGEVSVDAALDFLGKDGVRHPRNILFNWDRKTLWRELRIKVIDDGEDNVSPKAGTV